MATVVDEMEVYKYLIRAIRSKGELDYLERKYFIDYVSEIRDGKRNNDFYEVDFLNKIVLECINSDVSEKIAGFESVIKLTKVLLPFGLETDNYEVTKNMILSGNTFIDPILYALFDNRVDYIQVINMIKSDKLYQDNYDKIVKFAIGVSPYFINSSGLKAELFAFITGLNSELDNIDVYSKKRIEEAKRKCGIYDVDEKKLALIDNRIRKLNALMVSYDTMRQQVKDYRETINLLTRQGVTEITEHTNSQKNELNKQIIASQERISKVLSNYKDILETSLRESKDEMFRQLLLEFNKELDSIKSLTASLSKDTTQELLRVKEASEDAIRRFRQYVENEPQLRQLLTESVNYDELKDTIAKFEKVVKDGGEKTVFVETDAPVIHIPGYTREIIPASRNVNIPNVQMNSKILRAFDESIPFDVRFSEIMKRKEEREKNGELFHKMTDEIIRCVIEGDWPYLWGPSGCGKTHVVRQVASLIGIDMIMNGKITDKFSILGWNDANGRFVATQTFIAFAYGVMNFYDEFDNGNPDTHVVLNELNSSLCDVIYNPGEKRFVTFGSDMVVPINPNCRMMSAGNTPGEGQNRLYSARGKVDESGLQRQTPKRLDYDNRVEERIFGKNSSWYKLFVNFRKACEFYGKQKDLSSPPGMITTRDAAAIARYIKHNSKGADQVLMEKFVQTKNIEYLSMIIDMMEKTYGISRNDGNVEISKTTKLGDINEKVLARKLVYNSHMAIKEMQKKGTR